MDLSPLFLFMIIYVIRADPLTFSERGLDLKALKPQAFQARKIIYLEVLCGWSDRSKIHEFANLWFIMEVQGWYHFREQIILRFRMFIALFCHQ